MRPTLTKKILVATLSLLVPVLLLEGALHLAGYDPRSAALSGKGRVLRTSANPLLRYELTPGAVGHGWGTEVQINSHGFRDDELDPADTTRRRIAVLGDSITFGNHLTRDEVYPEVLEHELRARGLDFDVLNLGVGGYDTVQEVALLESRGLPFRPELVVVGFCVNDLGVVSVTMEHSWQEADREDPLYSSRIAQWLHEFLGERTRRAASADQNREEVYAATFTDQVAEVTDAELRRLMDTLRTRLRAREGAAEETDVIAARRIPPRWFVSEARVGRVQFAFERLARLAETRGFEVVVLLVPYLEEASWEGPYSVVRRLAELHGFDLLEVDGAYRGLGIEGLRIDPGDPVHPDATGHRVLAKALTDYVLAREGAAD